MDEYTAAEDIKKGDKVVLDLDKKTVSRVRAVAVRGMVDGSPDIRSERKISEIPNTEIIEVINAFEVAFDVKLRPLDEQRRYAKFLIKDYGREKVLQGIQAALAVRGRQYSPSITNLKELHFKWAKLVDYFARNSQQQKSNVTDLDNIE